MMKMMKKVAQRMQIKIVKRKKKPKLRKLLKRKNKRIDKNTMNYYNNLFNQLIFMLLKMKLSYLLFLCYYDNKFWEITDDTFDDFGISFLWFISIFSIFLFTNYYDELSLQSNSFNSLTLFRHSKSF